MFKVLFLLKRKEGITHEQFREHYERSHAKLAQKYLGHLMISYERNYVSQVWNYDSPDGQGIHWGYDCIAEWVLPNEAALKELFRIAKDPEIGKKLYDDEEHFLDREAVIAINCEDGDVVNTGTGGRHGTLEPQGVGG